MHTTNYFLFLYKFENNFFFFFVAKIKNKPFSKNMCPLEMKWLFSNCVET